MKFRRYLGDGVYACFDNYQIWLESGGPNNDENRITLDSPTFESLLKYDKDLRASLSHNPLDIKEQL